MKAKAVIIGRANVGKSTFFNRLCKNKDAITDNFAGVTRDRKYGIVKTKDKEFVLIDTGGLFSNDKDFSDAISSQAKSAINEAHIIIIMLDAKFGMSPFDTEIINLVRSSKKDIFFLANKIDSKEHKDKIYDLYLLGIKKIYPISAEHGFGISDFLKDLEKSIENLNFENLDKKEEEEKELIKVAVVGKPNAGKSSFINKILNEERLIVSDIPGTTRDSIDLKVTYKDKNYLFIDTAGIRRKKKVSQKIEKISVIKSLQSLNRCDIALILLDCSEEITEQDIKIAGYAFEKYCACIFLFNKWDLTEKKEKEIKKIYDKLKFEAKFLSYAPMLTISALTGLRVKKSFSLIDEVYGQYTAKIQTSKINDIIQKAMIKKPPSIYRGTRLKFFYATQVSTKPPSFICFVNYPDAVHFSYKRYLMNQIKQETNINMCPIKLDFRQRERSRKK